MISHMLSMPVPADHGRHAKLCKSKLNAIQIDRLGQYIHHLLLDRRACPSLGSRSSLSRSSRSLFPSRYNMKCWYMKMKSKHRLQPPRRSFTGFPVIPSYHNLFSRSTTESRISCKVLAILPVASNMIVLIFQPFVDCLLMLSSTCGTYFTSVSTSLIWEMT